MSKLIFEPCLLASVGQHDSRTDAFVARNFGTVSRPVAVEIRTQQEPSESQSLLAEVLVELVVRMEPVVSHVIIDGPTEFLETLEQTIAARFPMRRVAAAIAPSIIVSVGGGDAPFIDASSWSFGCDENVPQTSDATPVGAFLGALEAAKYVFARAVTLACGAKFDLPWKPGLFDAWGWKPGPSDAPLQTPEFSLNSIVAGCGGVGAAYLWFLSKLRHPGHVTLIDDDVIKLHNLNRLLFAAPADAVAGRKKVEIAADYMRRRGWIADAIPRKVEHVEALIALKRASTDGAVLISAVGEPQARLGFQGRGFSRVLDGATNSDGSAQVISVVKGAACIDCYLSPRTGTAPPPAPEGCGEVKTDEFAGVVAHLSATAGILLGIEHLKSALGAALGGVNVQPITRQISASSREIVTPCSRCPHILHA